MPKYMKSLLLWLKSMPRLFIENLGMSDLLHKHKNGPTLVVILADMHDSDDEDDEDQTDQDMESVINLVVQEVCAQKIPRQLKLT